MKELLILTPIAYITEYSRWTIRNLHTDNFQNRTENAIRRRLKKYKIH